MPDIVPLNHADWPLRYRMSLDANGEALLFRVHPGVFASLQKIKKDSRIILAGLAKFSTFSTGEDGFFGFDQSLSVDIEPDGWAMIRMPFPRRQSGNDHDYWKRLSACSHSLAVFTGITYWIAEPTEEADKQLLALESIDACGGLDHSGLSVILSPLLAKWLKQVGDDDLESIGKAMFTADKTLSPYEALGRPISHFSEEDWDRIRRYDFRASLDKSTDIPYLHLTVEGNACGLDPDGMFHHGNAGYRLVPHNVDNRIQQFDLIAGLARLWEIVESKMK